jgi:hypothetical protein
VVSLENYDIWRRINTNFTHFFPENRKKYSFFLETITYLQLLFSISCFIWPYTPLCICTSFLESKKLAFHCSCMHVCDVCVQCPWCNQSPDIWAIFFPPVLSPALRLWVDSFLLHCLPSILKDCWPRTPIRSPTSQESICLVLYLLSTPCPKPLVPCLWRVSPTPVH